MFEAGDRAHGEPEKERETSHSGDLGREEGTSGTREDRSASGHEMTFVSPCQVKSEASGEPPKQLHQFVL